MKDTVTYGRKWRYYIISFFIVSAAIILVSEFMHERKFRIQALNARLGNFATIADGFLKRYSMIERNDFSMMDSLVDMISNRYVRITVIGDDGCVLFDSQVRNPERMENHLQRPEIVQSLNKPFGTDTRISETTRTKYYYFARHQNNYFIRVSDVYDSARVFIQPSRIFIVFFILILLGVSLVLMVSASRYEKSMSNLKDFALKASENKPIDEGINFPETELGTIGQEIIHVYQNLARTKEELLSEREKLMRHLNLIEEGIAIFSKERKLITGNTHFTRLINYISDIRVFDAGYFFHIKEFKSLIEFIERETDKEKISGNAPVYEIFVSKGGRYFSVKSVVFQDKSFEVSIDDITRPTKRKVLKQQLTDNIAHELKTPVSSIKGFLETIIEANPDPVKSMEFIKRAYSQACRLADLVHDISVITKIEEAGALYRLEDVNVTDLVNDIAGELKSSMEDKNIDAQLSLPMGLLLKGNPGLLYSIFRNLFDNSIDHAGNDITIKVNHYLTDEKFHYFSYSDNGSGVPENDLPRLFERFYRVEKGRDRKQGGTGLGLAIVKNAVQFHKGEISARNREEGGLEFLFTLARDPETV